MDYKKEICPICLNEFADGDDIVVCPECGTPHHRECWALNNRCANDALHTEGFEWKSTAADKPEPEEQPFEVNNQNTETDSAGNTNVPFSIPVITSQDINEDGFENLCMRGVKANKESKVDGVRIGDIALYIQQNARNYINKFIKGKKITINWAALLFAPAWFFYRKLYKAGLLFLALTVAISLFTYPLSDKIIDEQQQIYETIGIDAADENVTGTDFVNAVEKKLAEDSSGKLMNKMYSLMGKSALWAGLKVLPNLIAALCANEIYRRKIKKDLSIINEATDDKSAKTALIMQRGGVSFIWGALVFIAADYIVPVLMQAGNLFTDLF